VGAATAIRWRQLALRLGRAVARKQGGDKRSGRIEAHAAFLLALVEDEGDPTLAEIQARLAERGMPVSLGTLHRLLARHGVTRKKRPGTRASRTTRMS
jgi:transposase